MGVYNQETIKNAMITKWAGNTVHFDDMTDSTNRVAKELAKEGAPAGTLAVSDYQSAGRGRFDRVWSAPKGTAITMSLILRPEFAPAAAPMLTLVMGLSVAQVMEEEGFTSKIKWPNDVVVNRKKICGILTEMSLQGAKIDSVVIGVGININIPEFPEEMQDKATSCYLETGKEFDRNLVIAKVMKQFEMNYEIFCRTCDMSALLSEYRRLLANQNQPVKVLEGEHPWEGICLGINEMGELLVELPDGSVREVFAGEVSVRGLYSYV